MVSVEKLTIALESGETFEVSIQEARTLAKDLLGILKNLQVKEEE
jgi:hypothetical protein